MTATHRSAIAGALFALLVLPGCILVIEENDFGRDHGLYGTSWGLEIFFYGGRSYDTHNQGYRIEFRDVDGLVGTAGCGEFEARYSVEADRIVIDRVRGETSSCGQDPVADLFIDGLARGTSFRLSGDRLVVSGDGGTELVFESQ